MYCRLLDDLETQARNATDRVHWARAACKISVHRARQGQHQEAQALILRIRETFGVELHHEIAPWVMLAEGVGHYFLQQQKPAWERMRRAYALAVALRMDAAKSSSAAWMAFVTYNMSRFDDMLAFLREVLVGSDVNDHHARGRAALVLADCYHSADRYDLARRWYDRTRIHAAAEGDQGLISAMLYNVAAIRTANNRIASAFGIRSEKEELRARMEAGSSMVYDKAVGARSWEDSTPLMRGQQYVIEEKFEQALELFEPIDERALHRADVPILLADRAYCFARLMQDEKSKSLVQRCSEALGCLTHPDDLAFVYSRLAAIARLAGTPNEAARCQTLADEHLDAHREFQASLLRSLATLDLAPASHQAH